MVLERLDLGGRRTSIRCLRRGVGHDNDAFL
jgi:hypothetical protein